MAVEFHGLSIEVIESEVPVFMGLEVELLDPPIAPVWNGLAFEFIEPAAAPRFDGIAIGIEDPAAAPVWFGLTVTEAAFNFRIKVQDLAGTVIEGAEVVLDSPLHLDQGLTDENGIHEGLIVLNEVNVMTVKKLGYQHYTHRFIPVEPADWEQTLNHIVPVVIYRGGQTAVNLRPNEPTNEVFD